MTDRSTNPLILYDGVCALCNGLVRFVLKRDRGDRFRFASLQSEPAREILSRYGVNSDVLDTFYLVLDNGQPGEQILSRSQATMRVLAELRGLPGVFATLMRIVPRFLRDFFYNLVARSRYRVFGKYDVCPLPAPGDRHKFLDP